MIRQYPRDFYDFVDGYVVSSRKDHDELNRQYNKVYMRALSGKGKGEPRGWLSPDEFIRLGSLFYILLRTSDTSYGVKLNQMGYLVNSWQGVKRVVSLNKKVFDEYSARLEESRFASVEPSQFFYRAIPETDSRTLWLFNYTAMEVMSKEQDVLKMEDLISSLDSSSLILNRGGRMIMVLPNDNIIVDLLRQYYGFTPSGTAGVFSNGELKLDTKRLGPRYLMVTDI